MNEAVGKETRQNPLPTDEQAGYSPFRQRCARFWLSVLFRASLSPGLAKFLRPLGTGATAFCSKKIRRNTALNSRYLLSPQATAKDRKQFCKAVVCSWYDFIYDIGLSLHADLAQLQKRVAGVVGDDTYHAMRAQKKGAIILTAHMGSFETGLVALRSVEKQPIHVVFQRDASEEFEKLRANFRRRMNITEAPIDQGPALWMQLRDALLRDEVVAIQGDRVMPGQKGMKVPMLAGHVLLPTGPFKLSAASGSPVVPIFSVRDGDGRIRIAIEPAIETSNDPDAITQSVLLFSKVLEKYLRRYPEQWLVLEPAFWENSANQP